MRSSILLRAIAAVGLVAGGISVQSGLAPAAATTSQTTVLSPKAGKATSSPDEPHHRAYGGDYSFDVAGTGDVFARFRNTNGSLSLSVAGIARACASGAFADGGDRITLNVLINGTRVGTVAYAHLTDFSYTSGAVPVGARLGRTVTTGDGVHSSTCWTGSHVHVEPRNDYRYGCYFAGQLGSTLTLDSRLGIVGGERAAAVNVPCPSDAETGTSIGNGSFIRRPDGAVFRIAGGAPLYVSTWDAFGGSQPYTDVSWDYYNALPAHPASNTFLRGSRTGRVFRVVGDGYRYYVASWESYGGAQPYIDVDDWALDNCDHLRCEPFGSLDVVSGVNGGIRLAGWVMDPDSTTPINIHVYSDGTYVTAFTANQSRTDVDAVFHRGANFGFDHSLAIPAGHHRICVYGINVSTGPGNPEIGCTEVDAKAKLSASINTTAAKNPVRRYTYDHVRGSLRIAGVAATNRVVSLARYAPATHRWVLLTSKRTSATGVADFTVRPSRTTTYRVRWAGSFFTRAASDTVQIRVTS